MTEKLSVPFEYSGKVWCAAEKGRTNGGVLADAQREASQERVYSAMYTYVAGTLRSLVTEDGTSEEGRNRIREICRQMPWASAEQLALHTLVASGTPDAIDGVYQCPRCGNQVVSEVDSADRISALPVLEATAGDVMELALAWPVEVKDSRGDPVVSVSSLRLRRPTLADCMAANVSYGLRDEVRLQYRVSVETIEAVNGEAADKKFRDTWGMYLFDRMDGEDLAAIARWNAAAGVQPMVRKRCTRCGKEWEVPVSTAGFFASGLRG
jgi:hypothetical protein